MKHLLNSFILIALLGFAGISFAEPVVETPAGNSAESVAVEIGHYICSSWSRCLCFSRCYYTYRQ